MSETEAIPSRRYSRRSDSALYRLDQVLKIVALGKTQLYALLAAGEFPKPIRIGQRSVRWHAGDVMAWIDKKRHLPPD
jgi:prophage regulatory protein